MPASQSDRLSSQRRQRGQSGEIGPAAATAPALGDVPPEFRGAFKDYTRRQGRRSSGWWLVVVQNQRTTTNHQPPTTTMTFPSRYLVPFGPKQTPHVFTDVLVIGGGIAGLRAALDSAAADARPRRHQGRRATQQQLLGPGRHRHGAVARGPLREPHRGHPHRRGRPCDRAVVEMVVREAPEQIDDLIEVGYPLRPGGRPPGPRTRGRAQPSPHRACARRRHRLRGHARHDRARPPGGQRRHLGEDVHPRPAGARGALRRRLRRPAAQGEDCSSGPSRSSWPAAAAA